MKVAPVPKAEFKTILLYASGNYGKSCLASLVEIYALFYFTDLIGIDPAVAGLVLLASLVLDALTDPLVGHLGDRWRDRWSSLLPYAVVGAPLTVMAFLALFMAPGLAGGQAGLIAIASLLAFRAAYTVFDVPHNGLLGLVTQTPEERTLAASLRIFFSALGKLTVTLVVAWIIQRAGGEGLDFAGLFVSAVLLAGLYLASVGASALSVRQVRFRPEGDPSPRARFKDLGRAIFGNRQVLVVFVLTAANSLMMPAVSAAFIYYAKYALMSEAAGTRAVMLLAVAQTLSLPVWAWYANRIQAKSVAAMVAYLTFAASAALGLAGADDIASMLIVAGLAGFSMGGIFMLNWSMLPDALDRAPTGAPIAGRFGVFGVYTLTNKAFSGFAQAYVGLVLAGVGFVANSELPPDVIDEAKIWMFAMPIFGACLCGAMLWRFGRA